MSTYAIRAQEQKQAAQLRRQYVSQVDNTIRQIQELDNTIKRPGKIAASILGSAGVLAIMAGTAIIVAWESMTLGLIFIIPGIGALLIACPVYAWITEKQKKNISQYESEVNR